MEISDNTYWDLRYAGYHKNLFLLRMTKGARHPFLVSDTLLTLWPDFFSMCSHSCAVLTNMHGMNGMWPWRPWCWVQDLSDVTVITWMHMPVMQRSLYMLWFNFILGVNFISFCFKLIITHNHAQKQREIKFKTRIKLNLIRKHV